MKITAIIPSRYGSKRFEGKPLFPIAGKSMIQRVYERIEKAEILSEVLVATDDQRIFDAVSAFGGRVVMTSKTNRSGTDRVAEVAEKLGLAPDDVVINVQGDQPLLDPGSLEQVVSPFISESGIEMSTLAIAINTEAEIINPNNAKVILDVNGFALYFSRSPIPYALENTIHFETYKHLGIYAYTRRFLDTFRRLPQGRLEVVEALEQLRALENGHRIRVIVTEYDSPEVDCPEDIERIEKCIQASAL